MPNTINNLSPISKTKNCKTIQIRPGSLFIDTLSVGIIY